ncbi:MAG: hypothetical protein IBX72_10145 [Nitrospirae bacterium]|jgi:MscS family membrane protein|nr:hypothetical protein [Nitrospirota bacterium]
MTGIIESFEISKSPYVNAFLSILLFIVLAKITDILINKVFRRFAKFTKSDIDNRIIDVIHRPIYLTIILIGSALVIAYLKASPDVVFYINNALYSAISIIWAITVIKLINITTEHVIYKAADVTGLSKDIIPQRFNSIT